MLGSLRKRLLAWIDATLGALGHGFIREWTKVERSYRRPMSSVAVRLRFAFYPLLAIGAIGWLALVFRAHVLFRREVTDSMKRKPRVSGTKS